jgi:hypothetical protein
MHKKGDKRKCKNYRGISVTSTISRIDGRILAKLVESECKYMETEEQLGFRDGSLSIVKRFCITQVIKKGTNRELYIFFIDLTKAYDSTPLNTLWETLNESTINTRLIETIKSLHKGSSSKIKKSKPDYKSLQTY